MPGSEGSEWTLSVGRFACSCQPSNGVVRPSPKDGIRVQSNIDYSAALNSDGGCRERSHHASFVPANRVHDIHERPGFRLLRYPWVLVGCKQNLQEFRRILADQGIRCIANRGALRGHLLDPEWQSLCPEAAMRSRRERVSADGELSPTEFRPTATWKIPVQALSRPLQRRNLTPGGSAEIRGAPSSSGPGGKASLLNMCTGRQA